MKKLFYLTAMLLALCACRKDPGADNGVKGRLALRFSSVLQDDAIQTKATESLMSTTNTDAIGIFICDHCANGLDNPYKPFSTGMNNIQSKTKVTDGVQEWTFTPSGSSSSFNSLVISAKELDDENITADVFAYYPYNSSVTTPEQIPFTLNWISDPAHYYYLMYAEENKVDNPSNKNLDPNAENSSPGSDINEVEVGLHFRHAFARIEVNLVNRNGYSNNPDKNTAADPCSATVVLKKKSGHMYNKGIFNAVSCSFESLEPCDSLMASLRKKKNQYGGGNVDIYMNSPIVPTQEGEEYEDGDYEFSFTVDGIELSAKIPLLKEHLRHGTSEVYGFQAGYKYIFNFTYDNFVRLSSIEIAEWTVQDDPLYEIDI